MSPKRGTISVSKALYDRLHAFTKERGISVAALVEELLEPVLIGTLTPSGPALAAAALAPEPAPSPPNRAEIDQIAAGRRMLGLAAAAMPRVTATSNVALDVSPVLAEAISDQVARGRAAGQEVESGQVLESAILRMLDAMTRLPWCRTCLEAIEDCRCRQSSVRR